VATDNIWLTMLMALLTLSLLPEALARSYFHTRAVLRSLSAETAAALCGAATCRGPMVPTPHPPLSSEYCKYTTVKALAFWLKSAKPLKLFPLNSIS